MDGFLHYLCSKINNRALCTKILLMWVPDTRGMADTNELLTEDSSSFIAVGQQWDPKSLLGYRFLFLSATVYAMCFYFSRWYIWILWETIIFLGSLELSQGETWCLAKWTRGPISMSSTWIWLSAGEIVTVCLDNLYLELAWAFSISAF